MRLISTLKDQAQAQALASYLQQLGIDNQLEIITNTDWGSSDYGTVVCHIWVIEEDRFEEALRIATEFNEDPANPRFHTPLPTSPEIAAAHTENLIQENSIQEGKPAPQPMGIVTLYLLLICTVLLIISTFTAPAVLKVPPNVPYTPLYTAPVYKTLMFDYPKTFQLVDQLVEKYGIDNLEDPSLLPKAGQNLFQQMLHTPYWHGLYDKIVLHFKDPNASWNFDAPLFEKIRQGEIWRLFTPCLLHSDILHLLFNMVWLVVLGKQLEQRMGKQLYILFIVLTAILSNCAQYMMGGSGFLGFSGVLCAMLGFIWIRQKRAAWEGYQLEKSTLGFIALFILFMFSIQILSFFLEISGGSALPIGIANTAHMVGGISGILLAYTNWFSWRSIA